MYNRVPIKEAIKIKSLSKDEILKLKLALEIRIFAETDLKLSKTNNYTSFVKLKSRYPTYTVSASDKFQLKSYYWDFPFTGKVSYKGFPQAKLAQEEAKTFSSERYDTYVRGAGAYSTLGWFDDPIFSSMLRYSEHDFVNVIIHETVHATIYIKNNTDFNERIATYVANQGTKLFYLKKEGENSKTIRRIKNELFDENLFSEFFSREIDLLKTWYKNQKNINVNKKNKRIKEMISRFKKTILPKMKTNKYKYFLKYPLNNAALLGLKTYQYDLSDFDKAFKKLNNNFEKFLAFCKSLSNKKDPQAELKEFIKN